ncbi:MAG: STAS domain-containing protein [Ruminococcus sp.]
MEIKVTTNNSEMVVAPVGRLDTNTSPELEKELGKMPEGISTLIFDFEMLRYISSAGLRVLLSTQKKINALNGKMIIKNANEMIMEVFEVTGFLDILTVENE